MKNQTEHIKYVRFAIGKMTQFNRLNQIMKVEQIEVSLNQAKRNFSEFGACERDMIKNVNKVHKTDVRNPKYKME